MVKQSALGVFLHCRRQVGIYFQCISLMQRNCHQDQEFSDVECFVFTMWHGSVAYSPCSAESSSSSCLWMWNYWFCTYSNLNRRHTSTFEIELSVCPCKTDWLHYQRMQVQRKWFNLSWYVQLFPLQKKIIMKVILQLHKK